MPPDVSIVVPCYNEEKTIRLLLEAILRQTFPANRMEVVLADGLSTDRTREEVERFQTDFPDLKVKIVDNLQRSIPSGVNTAIQASVGGTVIRLDAHSVPAPDYVERCLAALDAGRGENVGGVWEIRPGGPGWMARAIARAAAHPLGVGDALYRVGAQAGAVDTVPFGAFRRATLDRLGGFDESLKSNEDYELNARLRLSGGKVWLDPAIRSIYFARSTPGALARQYFRYGYWKVRMLLRYPKTLRWRQALPPLFVAGLAGLTILALFWPPARLAWAALVAVYFLILLAGSLPVAIREKSPALVVGIPCAIVVMHTAWGSGFLVSLVKFWFEPHG